MRSTFGEWFLVVYLFNWNQDSVFVALFAERMFFHIPPAYLLPCPSVLLLRIRVPAVLLVSLIFHPLMFITEPSLSKHGTSGVGTWPFRFPWHRYTSISESHSKDYVGLTKAIHLLNICIYCHFHCFFNILVLIFNELIPLNKLFIKSIF